MSTLLEVGAYEAKTKLGTLLDAVEKGHRVTITRHGSPVAILGPVQQSVRPAVSETVSALRDFRRGRTLNATVNELIAEGRP